MIASNLIDRIRLGEDSTLEFKRVDVADRRVKSPDWGEPAAVANGRGGTAVLGGRWQGPVHGQHLHRAVVALAQNTRRSTCMRPPTASPPGARPAIGLSITTPSGRTQRWVGGRRPKPGEARHLRI